jgi:hypothetical protein
VTVARGAPTIPFPWPSAWEYQDLSLEYEGSWSAALDELGKEGWMVVTAIHDESTKGDKELRVLLMRPRSGVGGAAKAEGRVKKRSKTTETGHEVVEDDESEEDAP